MQAGVRLPSIDALSAFEASARLGSFERAATELHITASAVSKRVATLEDLLGAQILTRGPKALSLTALGKDYLAQVQQVLQLLGDMPQHQRKVQRTERLVLSALPTFARRVLMPRLYEYVDAHPELDLEILTSIPYLDVVGQECHLEVRHGRPEAVGATPLMRDVVVPVATPTLCQDLSMRAPQDLVGAPLIRCPLEPWRHWFQAAGIEASEPSHGPRFVDVGLMYEAALQGRGVALARPSLAQGWLRDGSLRPVLPLAAPTEPQYYLGQAAKSEGAQHFAAWLQQICTDAAEQGLATLSSVCGENFRLL